MTDASLVFPAPSLVLGMGRFGLAVLERMGEDWQQLRLSGADLSLKNLRLLWLHPADEEEGCWRRQEREQVRIARYIQDGDLPSIALDFVLLRTMGLIRHHYGLYQVSVPRDRGPIRVSDLGLKTEEDGQEEQRMVRRRFFEWQNLDPDPLHAAEKLRRLAEHNSPLHLFIAPLINRIRQGHSPWVLLAAILRCGSLAAGRDPAPWGWVREHLAQDDHADGNAAISQVEIQEARRDLLEHDRLLDDLAQQPLRPKGEGSSTAGDWEFEEPEIFVPEAFVPQLSDPEAPFDPLQLLNENWQTTGWATRDEEEQGQEFATLKVSPFRLGLFDHAAAQGAMADKVGEALRPRLGLLSGLLHKSLVRLWGDLRREEVEETGSSPGLRRLEAVDEALQQSLSVLYELMIRPLEEDDERADPSEGLRCLEDLPAQPTRFLRALALEPDPWVLEERALERRLGALGLADPEHLPPARRPLLYEIPLSMDDGRRADTETEPSLPMQSFTGDEQAKASQEVREPRQVDGSTKDQPRNLRKVLNLTVRDLLNFSYLAAYRKKATRTPPRLTVFVVGDMSEPFTRIKMTEALRDVHSELLRSFSSMFELHRQGFDRALSIVPILWMPHPADPFGGEPLEKTRLEEAVIIDAVHKVRRWVESVLPGARRRISQIFINGRVTDNAVLTLRDCIQQTRDFLTFQIRNDLSRDDWLRRAAMGPGGDDFFSSFACAEIEFPAERAREYLANRLARECLHRLRGEPRSPGSRGNRLPKPPDEEELVTEASASIESETLARARKLSDGVWQALSGDPALGRCRPSVEVIDAFDDRFGSKLWGGVLRLWQELTQSRGRMDSLVDDLRCRVTGELRLALPRIRHDSDDDIQQVSGHGLPAVLSRLEERRREAFSLLQATEEERRSWEQACLQHLAPASRELQAARKAIVEQARAKPDCGPQRLGMLAWVLLTPATASLLALLAIPKFGESLGFVASSTVLVLVAGALLWSHTRRHHHRLQKAIEHLSEVVRRLVAGSDDGGLAGQAPSLRSFFEMRLRLTSALARRGYALHAYEQAAVDERLGHRLHESLDIQEHRMLRRAEDLGVRPAAPGSDDRDDLRHLFVRRVGERMDKLIDPAHLVEYYQSRIRSDDLPVIDFLDRAGGFRDWRKTACLSDAESVMAYGRDLFGSVASRPIAELDYFSDVAGEHLRNFVRRNYSNLGFGAKFLGYEGLDPDGVRLVADAALVADRPLIAAYERAEDQRRKKDPHQGRPRTLERLVAGVRPNAAYMFSLVQGVRAHSVHNLKRFESFHDRSDEAHESPPAVHLLTGYQDCGKDLLGKVRFGGADLRCVDRRGEVEENSQAEGEDDDGLV